MRSGEEIQGDLRNFVVHRRYYSDSERSEAQNFLNSRQLREPTPPSMSWHQRQRITPAGRSPLHRLPPSRSKEGPVHGIHQDGQTRQLSDDLRALPCRYLFAEVPAPGSLPGASGRVSRHGEGFRGR